MTAKGVTVLSQLKLRSLWWDFVLRGRSRQMHRLIVKADTRNRDAVYSHIMSRISHEIPDDITTVSVWHAGRTCYAFTGVHVAEWAACRVHHTANQHHPALVGPICDPPRLTNSTSLARRLTMGSEVSQSMDQLSGTGLPAEFRSPDISLDVFKARHFCLTADLAHLVYLF